jgi:hypothetical protein
MTKDSPYSPVPDGALISAYDQGFSDTRPVREAERDALRAVSKVVLESVASELDQIVDSVDEHVTRPEILAAIAELARELRS